MRHKTQRALALSAIFCLAFPTQILQVFSQGEQTTVNYHFVNQADLTPEQLQQVVKENPTGTATTDVADYHWFMSKMQAQNLNHLVNPMNLQHHRKSPLNLRVRPLQSPRAPLPQNLSPPAHQIPRVPNRLARQSPIPRVPVHQNLLLYLETQNHPNRKTQAHFLRRVS